MRNVCCLTLPVLGKVWAQVVLAYRLVFFVCILKLVYTMVLFVGNTILVILKKILLEFAQSASIYLHLIILFLLSIFIFFKVLLLVVRVLLNVIVLPVLMLIWLKRNLRLSLAEICDFHLVIYVLIIVTFFDLTFILLRSKEVTLAELFTLFDILLRSFFCLTMFHHEVIFVFRKLLLHEYILCQLSLTSFAVLPVIGIVL